MKESYEEGLANHSAPNPTLVTVTSRVWHGPGVHAGQVSSPDIRNPGLPTPCPNAEGNIGWRAIASAIRNPRGPRP